MCSGHCRDIRGTSTYTGKGLFSYLNGLTRDPPSSQATADDADHLVPGGSGRFRSIPRPPPNWRGMEESVLDNGEKDGGSGFGEAVTPPDLSLLKVEVFTLNTRAPEIPLHISDPLVSRFAVACSQSTVQQIFADDKVKGSADAQKHQANFNDHQARMQAPAYRHYNPHEYPLELAQAREQGYMQCRDLNSALGKTAALTDELLCWTKHVIEELCDKSNGPNGRMYDMVSVARASICYFPHAVPTT